MNDHDKIEEIKRRLELTDLSMGRIVEDLIRVLVQRGLIKYSDFCDESREILREREELRDNLRNLLRGIETKHENISPTSENEGLTK